MHASKNKEALRNLSALVDFSNLINSTLDLELTLNNLIFTCFGKFQSSRGFVALIDEDNNLKPRVSKGTKEEIIDDFPTINAAELDSDKNLILFQEKYGFPLKAIIEASGRTIGVLFLGERLIDKNYDNADVEFVKTINNIAASAIQNSLIVNELKSVNRNLDSKVNQLSSLFDLSKEFSSVLETERVGKLLVYSIIGQLMVTKFAVVTVDNDSVQIMESRFPADTLLSALKSCKKSDLAQPQHKDKIKINSPPLVDLGVELIIPMQIKSETKGLIILGSRTSHVPFSQSDIEYISSVGSLAIISIENGRLFEEALEKQRLEKDLEIAQNIQKNLLPNKIPALDNFEFAAVNNSARQVGGDYYDIVKLNDGRTLFAIADVSGKGVQAALLMANLQAFLQSICKQNIELNEASNLINDLVSENTTDGSFITFFWGIINDKTMELTYVNMGHNPPLLIRDGEIRKLKLGGMILGVMPTVIPYKSDSFVLESGDMLVMFTDGITEAMNNKCEEYTDEKFEELVSGMGNISAEEMLNNILDDVKVFIEGAPQSDDVTAMVIKVK